VLGVGCGESVGHFPVLTGSGGDRFPATSARGPFGAA
jgi:hypothetical protein